MNSVTYVLLSENVGYCVLVDCGDYETLLPVLKRIGKRVKSVLLTHGHSDHIFGLSGLLKDEPDVEVCTLECGHEELGNSRKNLSFYHGTPLEITGYKIRILKDGEKLHFKGLADIKVIATPGHSPSCLSYVIEETNESSVSTGIRGYLFTGDAYIPGIKVFTKFPRSNKEQALESIERLTQMENDGYTVLCGHHSVKL